MINLFQDGLKLTAESRNISYYENKSEKDMVKAFSKPKPKIRINKKKFEEIRKDFNELRHKFSKKEIDKYRKAFYDIKNYRYLSTSEIKEAGKNLNELKKSVRSKKFNGDIDSVDYDDLDDYDAVDSADDDEYRRIGRIRRLFGNDYYKPVRTDDGFAGRRSNYIEYMSRGDRYGNLSPKEYLDMIRPYLRDLINDHKPTSELTNRAINNDSERRELKIQILMQNNCVPNKDFEETPTIYSASKPVEILMRSDTNDTIDSLFDTLLQRFQQAIETSNERGSKFTHESVALMYYYIQKIYTRRAGESYIKSLDWVVNKGATINQKNGKDNKCFQYSITSIVNYNKILKKYLQRIEKLKWVVQSFHHTKEAGKNLNKTILQLLLMSYLYHTIVKK